MHRFLPRVAVAVVGVALAPQVASAQADPRLESLKEEALEMVEARSKLVQEIIDHLFSFGELGMQEFETQRYLTGLLEEEGCASRSARTSTAFPSRTRSPAWPIGTPSSGWLPGTERATTPVRP
jgi:hypothetical protein